MLVQGTWVPPHLMSTGHMGNPSPDEYMAHGYPPHLMSTGHVGTPSPDEYRAQISRVWTMETCQCEHLREGFCS